MVGGTVDFNPCRQIFVMFLCHVTKEMLKCPDTSIRNWPPVQIYDVIKKRSFGIPNPIDRLSR